MSDFDEQNESQRYEFEFLPPGKECLAYIARAISAAPVQNTGELRIKSEALLWLANLLDP